MTENDFAQLKAAAFHDAVLPETTAIGTEVEIDIAVYDIDRSHFKGVCVSYVSLDENTCLDVYILADEFILDNQDAGLVIPLRDIDGLIALLTRARQIMAEGGTA